MLELSEAARPWGCRFHELQAASRVESEASNEPAADLEKDGEIRQLRADVARLHHQLNESHAELRDMQGWSTED